jgi:hypothetical protein
MVVGGERVGYLRAVVVAVAETFDAVFEEADPIVLF